MRVCIILPPAPGLFDQRTNIPLGPLYVAAVLEQAGHDVFVVSLLDHDVPATWPEADLYAMGFTTPQVGAAKGILELIRSQHPNAIVVAGGAHPSALPQETLALGFNSVIIGEAEKTILVLVSEFPKLRSVYYGIPVDNLDSIPFPARHLLPPEDIYNDSSPVFRDEQQGSHVAGLMTSRGCPGKCAFCSTYRKNCRHRSAKNIVEEMKQLYDMGVTCFKFQDDTFTLSLSHMIEVGSAVAKEFAEGEILVRVITRVDTFSEKMIPALRKMRTQVVSFGLESGSQKILDLAAKGITIEKSEHALALAKSAGFKTFGYIMFGLPGECEETVDETIAFLERNRNNLDVCVLSIFVPYPGCAIANDPEEYRVHILDNDWNQWWTVQKRTVLALPYDVSFTEMLRLKEKMIDAFIRLGYARPEWEHDR